MVFAEAVNLAKELIFGGVDRGDGVGKGVFEHDARGENLEDVADATAETDSLVAGEVEEGEFSGRDGAVALGQEAHGVEGVEDVLGGLHDAGVGRVGKGPAEFEFRLG